MHRAFGFDNKYTQQERITRKALALSWLIITLMPLPVCLWTPSGWAYYALYLFPVLFGLQPFYSKTLKRKFIFHWLICGTMMIVAFAIPGILLIALPFMFVMQCVYFMYWQLENRLYAIRKALQEYDFDDIQQEDSPEMVKSLVWSTFQKAFLPALIGTLCCCLLALIQGPGVGLCISIPVFIIILCIMHKKLKVFKLQGTYKADNINKAP